MTGIGVPPGSEGIVNMRRWEQTPAEQDLARLRAERGLPPSSPTSPGVRATPFRWIEPSEIPPRRWLFGRHAVGGLISVTGAAGGVGKTNLATVEQLSLISGRDLLGDKPAGPVRCWYIGLEDPLEEYLRRFTAAALHHDIDPKILEDNLFLNSGRDQDFIIAHEGKGGIVIAEPIVAAIIREINARGVGYVVVDPFVASHRVDESANIKIEAVAREWARIAQETGAAIELVHHLRKGAGGVEASADDLRGASALVNAARSVRVLVPMTAEEASDAGVEKRRGFFRVQSVKANLAPAPEDAIWRQIVSVPLGNGGDGPGDWIGVVAAWQWPSALDGMTANDLFRVQRKVADGRWREDVRASNWVGVAVAEVLALNLEEASAKARVKAMLKIWIKNGALKIVQRRDEEARREKPFVEVGQWAV